jgi:hypothetical protein
VEFRCESKGHLLARATSENGADPILHVPHLAGGGELNGFAPQQGKHNATDNLCH